VKICGLTRACGSEFAGIDTISMPSRWSAPSFSSEQRAGSTRTGLDVSQRPGRCKVFDGDRETVRSEDVTFGAGEAPLLVVKSGAKLPYEIPFAQAYLEKVDLARKQIGAPFRKVCWT